MLKRAVVLNHLVTNIEMMQSETSTWNVMEAGEKKLSDEINSHAEEHGFTVSAEGIKHMWVRQYKPEPRFLLTSMATLQKEELDTSLDEA